MSYMHLTRDDRVRLDVLLRAGLSITDCALNLGVSRITVSKEVSRNGGRYNYNPFKAQREARKRRLEANQYHRKFDESNPETKATIKLLRLGWSPEQIVGRIKLEAKVKPFCVATIYNNVNPNKGLSKLLPRKHNKYRRTRNCKIRKGLRESLESKKSIDLRPEIVDLRERLGDWEGDTIIGREKTARILTHVERKSGYLLANLMLSVTAEKISFKSIEAFKKIPKQKKYSITYDNGSEFADHEWTERQAKISIYFAHPYHSWERGTNENTNGLLRRYFPKGTLFSNISEEQLTKVVKSLNQKPRKRLGYKTPHEVFHGVKLRTLI